MELSVLDKKVINASEEGDYVRGYAFVQTYCLMPQKNGGKYIQGQLQSKGIIPFKIWSDSDPSSAYAILSKDLNGYESTVCLIDGKVNKFGGTTQLIVSYIEAVDVKSLGLSDSDFLEEVYEVNKWWNKLETTLSKNCSDSAVGLFNELVAPIKERFLVEFAAIFHHDNCKSGLLAHTTKVVRMASMIKMYPELMERISSDVLFLSCALHDIGKVFEYSNGSISLDGKMLSHNTMGIMYIMKYEDLIKEKMGEKFFNSLVSVIQQHHGEYGERPRTLVAYIVHRLDALDAHLTTLNDMVKESDGEQIKYDNCKLI